MELLRIWKHNEVDKVWIMVEDLVQAALDRSGGYADHDHIKEQIKKNLMQLWIAWADDKKKVYAIGVTEIKQYPKYKTLNFRILTGGDRIQWIGFADTIEEWATTQGVKKMELYARPGWERVLKPKGYVKTHVQLDKEIGAQK